MKAKLSQVLVLSSMVAKLIAADLVFSDDAITQFCEAAQNGEQKVVLDFLEKGMPVDVRDSKGRTALMLAVSQGRRDTISSLVENGADINNLSTSENGTQVITWAIQPDNLETIKWLIDEGAEIDVQGRNGLSPLCRAIGMGQVDVAKYLITRGASIELKGLPYTTYRTGEQILLSPLHTAVVYNQMEMFYYLLRQGADINELNENGESTLILAVQKGNTSLAGDIIKSGGLVNSTTEQSHTALMYAAHNGLQELVTLLLENGADPDLEGADIVDGRDDRKYTARDFAARRGHYKVVKQLLAAETAIK